MTTVNAVNTYIVPTTNREVTAPSQPCFLGFLSGTDSNVTGAGTAYTVGTNTAFTEIYDQNSDFNTNGTFTAPVTGRYLLNMSIQADNFAVGMNQCVFDIVTSNRTYLGIVVSPIAAVNAGTNDIVFGSSLVADMDAADTAACLLNINGGVGDTVDLETNGTFFSGSLLC